MSKPIPSGTLLRVGTFTVCTGMVHDQYEEITGFIVACTPEEIAALETLPMYQRVELRVVEPKETKP